MESRVYRDKKSTLLLVSAPNVSVVVFGCLSDGGAALPLEIFRFGLVGCPESLGEVIRPEGNLRPERTPRVNI